MLAAGFGFSTNLPNKMLPTLAVYANIDSVPEGRHGILLQAKSLACV
jgi:hypothetical protein